MAFSWPSVDTYDYSASSNIGQCTRANVTLHRAIQDLLQSLTWDESEGPEASTHLKTVVNSAETVVKCMTAHHALSAGFPSGSAYSKRTNERFVPTTFTQVETYANRGKVDGYASKVREIDTALKTSLDLHKIDLSRFEAESRSQLRTIGGGRKVLNCKEMDVSLDDILTNPQGTQQEIAKALILSKSSRLAWLSELLAEELKCSHASGGKKERVGTLFVPEFIPSLHFQRSKTQGLDKPADASPWSEGEDSDDDYKDGLELGSGVTPYYR